MGELGHISLPISGTSDALIVEGGQTKFTVGQYTGATATITLSKIKNVISVAFAPGYEITQSQTLVPTPYVTSITDGTIKVSSNGSQGPFYWIVIGTE